MRLGRFFAVDPLARQYPHNSPYAFSENVVINAIELEGREMSFSYNSVNVENISNNKSKVQISYDVDIHIKVLNITKDKSKITGIDKLASGVQKRMNSTFGNMAGNAIFTPTHDLSGNPLTKDNLLKQVNVNATQRKFNITMEVVDDISEISGDDYVLILTDKQLNKTRKYDSSVHVPAYASQANGQAMIVNMKEFGIKKSVVGNEYSFSGTTGTMVNVINHEFGHLLGLLDKYKDTKDGYILPDEFKTNVMGDSRYQGLNKEQKTEIIFQQLLRYNSYNRSGEANTGAKEQTQEILSDEN